MASKPCKTCLIEQDLSCFRLISNKNRPNSYYKNTCYKCDAKKSLEYYTKNKDLVNSKRRVRRKDIDIKLKEREYGRNYENNRKKTEANNLEDTYKLCHYTNLQPLWAKDNLEKRFTDG